MLAESKFVDEVKQLCTLSRRFCKDPWILKESNIPHLPVWAEISEFFADPTTGKRLKRTSSICYSSSYNVPTFWFNFYDLDGNLLLYHQFQQFAFVQWQSAGENLLEYITQAEHPQLGVAFYNFHPCKTANFMKALNTKNFVLSFLSSINSVFISNWPLEFFAAGLDDRKEEVEAEKGQQPVTAVVQTICGQ